MLKWRRPLPLVRPEGGGSPPELDPLEGRALHPTHNIPVSVMLSEQALAGRSCWVSLHLFTAAVIHSQPKVATVQIDLLRFLAQ